MKVSVKDIDIRYDSNMNPEIILKGATKKELKTFDKLKAAVSNNKKLTAEIKQVRKTRSLDANSYCWVLCQKIADEVSNTKENIYKEIIKRVGQFQIVPIKNEDVERWVRCWDSKGLGWFSEVMYDSKLEGYKKVINYFGSSVYNSLEMCKFIDELIFECNDLGIETKSKEEIESLKSSWNGIKKAV